MNNKRLYRSTSNGITSPASSSGRHGLCRDHEKVKEYLFKVLVIGELGTGKTSFIKRYVHQFFSSQYRATIGVDFALKVIRWNRNSIVRVQLWDIAGQERFGQMTRVYYKEAAGALVVFDVSRPSTFEAVIKWKTDLDSKVSMPDGSPIPCLLLANKCDQVKSGSLGDATFLDNFCQDNGFIGWFFTSPKENVKIEESCNFLIRSIISRRRQVDDPSDDSRLDLDDSEDFNHVINLKNRYSRRRSSSSRPASCC